MKRLFGRSVLTLIVAVISYECASPSETPDHILGIKVGLSIARWHGEDATFSLRSISPSFGTSVMFGSFYSRRISKLIDLQFEVLYVEKGTRYRDLPDKHYYRIKYLEIPLFIKLKIPSHCSVAPSLYVGPATSINLDAEWELKTSRTPGRADLVNVKALDFGLAAGSSFDIILSQFRIFVDIRYTLGLTNIAGNEEELRLPQELALRNNMHVRNSSIYTLIGIGF